MILVNSKIINEVFGDDKFVQKVTKLFDEYPWSISRFGVFTEVYVPSNPFGIVEETLYVISLKDTTNLDAVKEKYLQFLEKCELVISRQFVVLENMEQDALREKEAMWDTEQEVLNFILASPQARNPVNVCGEYMFFICFFYYRALAATFLSGFWSQNDTVNSKWIDISMLQNFGQKLIRVFTDITKVVPNIFGFFAAGAEPEKTDLNFNWFLHRISAKILKKWPINLKFFYYQPK